jgi:hypothetical protein
MPHAIVIGANGRRHEVDFEDADYRGVRGRNDD